MLEFPLLQPAVTHELVASHNLGHNVSGISANGSVADMSTAGVQGALAVKYSMLSLATETACQIVRIDEVIVHARDDIF